MKYIILIIILLSGCMSKIPTLKTEPYNAPIVQKVNFSDIDVNKDGVINKDEYNSMPSNGEIDAQSPIIWFIIIIILISVVLFVTKSFKKQS